LFIYFKIKIALALGRIRKAKFFLIRKGKNIHKKEKNIFDIGLGISSWNLLKKSNISQKN